LKTKKTKKKDQKNKEEVFVHAQKDYNEMVLNDKAEHIKPDRHQKIERTRFTEIDLDDHLTVKQNRQLHVHNNQSHTIDGSSHNKIADKLTFDVGNEVHIKAGQKVVIEAGAEITLKVGGTFVKIDPSGVFNVGSAIGLNAGGSAGSGSGYAGVLPEMPKEVIPAKNPPPFEPPPAQVPATYAQQLQEDLVNDTAVSPACQKKTDGTCPLSDCPCGNNQA